MRAARATLIIGATALFSALSPAVASAAPTQADLGAGKFPTVTTDAAGTGFIAWSDPNGNGPVFFCKLARGASSCAAGGPVTFSPPMASDDTFTPPYAFQRPDGSLVLSVDRSFKQVIWTSTDGGATWSPATNAEGNQIGDVNPSGQAILAPDGSGQEVITDTTTGGVDLQFQPFGGPAQTTHALFASYEYGGTIATVNAGLTIAAFWQIPGAGGTNSSAFSLFHGAPGTAPARPPWSSAPTWSRSRRRLAACARGWSRPSCS